MSSVLLVVHPDRPEARDLAANAVKWFASRGWSATVWNAHDPVLPHAIDFAVSLGGDGTMLHTVQLALTDDAPVLGINLGRMGYLAAVEPAAMEDAFERLVRDDFAIDERMVLQVGVTTAAAGEQRILALNEAIVEKTGPGHTIRVGVSIGGKPFLTYVMDGLLACTPTGSTAYNLSARGPVVSPRLDAVIMTPIAPHLPFDRSLVLAPSEELELRLLDGRPAAVVIDGARTIPLEPDDHVTISAAPERARLVSFGEHFHSVLRSRFGLSDR